MNRWLASSAITLACTGIIRAQSTQQAAPFNNGVVTGAATQPAEIPITAVKLFSSGVGYFERAGVVNGEDHTTLTFKTAQINDMLKSLVLQDLDGGTLGTIRYATEESADRALAGFSLNLSNNPSLFNLLSDLRGSPLTLSYGPDKITGTLLGTELKQRGPADEKGNKTEIPILNLLIGTTIRAIPLDDVRDVQIDDPKLQHDLTAALLVVAGSRNVDEKPVDIDFHGNGQRHVKIGYVVEAPVWKTSYRLVFDGDKPHLQGWAMVENQTDADWNNVQLSLVSGRPISFIENLYSPIYLQRPTIQPNLYGGLQPPAADGGAVAASVPATEPRNADAPQMPMSTLSGGNGALFDGGRESKPLDPIASIIAMASTASLGELFSYTIDNVTLHRHESAMLPVVTDAIDAQRLSIFNDQTLQTHPLNGVRLKNTTGKHLLQGPVTIFDHDTYAGDAQLDNLPPGESRLLSYGIDLQTTVNAEQDKSDVTLVSASINKGVLLLKRRSTSAHDFKIENKSDRAKTLVIEDPVRYNWTLIDTPRPVEITDTENRFQLDIPAGQSTTFTVKQQTSEGEKVQILPTSEPKLAQYLQYISTGTISKTVKDALAKVVELKSAVVATQQSIDDHKTQLKSIADEQGRIRENMKAIDPQSDYYTRLMKKLNDQETQIEKLQAEAGDLQKTRVDETKAVDDYVKALSVE